MRNIKKMITSYFERVINIRRWEHDPVLQINVFVSYG